MDEIREADTFFVVFRWMKDAGLRGLEKEIFAIIHGFSKSGQGRFTGSLNYLSEVTGASPEACCRILKQLTTQKFIEKEVIIKNKVRTCSYGVLIKSQGGIDKKSNRVLIKSQGGIDKLSNNNKEYNKDNIKDNNISRETPEPPYAETEIQSVDSFLESRDKAGMQESVLSSPKETPPMAAAPPLKKSKRSSTFSNIDESYILAFNAGINRAGGTPTVRRSDKLKAKDLKDTMAALDIAQAEGWIEEAGGAKEFLNVLGFRHFSRLNDFSMSHALSLETARRNIEKSWAWSIGQNKQPKYGRGASVSTFESGRTEEQTNKWLAQRIARTKEIQEQGVKNGEPNTGADS